MVAAWLVAEAKYALYRAADERGDMATREIDIVLSVPDREPYEDNATKRQKHKVWTLGYHDTTVIDSLGKNQASAVIDQLISIRERELNKIGAKNSERVLIVLAAVAGFCVITFLIVKLCLHSRL